MIAKYALLVGPYFMGSVIIAFVLAIASVWWNRSLIFKVTALLALGALIGLNFTAVNNFHKLAFDNLSKPKPVSFLELQNMLPEGHLGHLVLYGEIKNESGIYLLLRSPNYSEPRYYLMPADKKLQEQFRGAQQKAREKGTQLLLGGKPKRGESGEGEGKIKGFDKSPPTIFHPAPVSGGSEKNQRLPQDQPVIIPTPN